MEVLLTLLSICTFFVLCVDSGNVFKDANVSGRNLLKVCNPVGFKGDTVQTKQTKRNANRKLAWIGAFVQYTPWMEYNGCGRLRDISKTANQDFEAEPNMYECYQYCNETNHAYDYIGMRKQFCYCLDREQLDEMYPSCKVKKCGNLLCFDGREKTWVTLYTLKHTFPGNDSQVGQCSVFNYDNNISFNSKRCSETSHPVCFTNKTNASANKGYAKTNSTWSESMIQCTKQKSPSSVENLRSAEYSNTPYGTYWTTSVRAATFIPVQVGKQESVVFHCVAAWVSEDYTIEERVIEHCDKSLPVLCLESTTETELTNSSQTTVKRHSTPDYIENKVDEEHKSQIPWVIIAGIIGGIGILISIVLVILKYRKRSLTTIEKSVAVTVLNVRNPNASNEETLEADNTNIYDAGNSEERCVMLKDSDYDSMSAIRQDTEGVYDHTNSTHNTHGKNEDLDVYDHADPVIVKQSLQIENDGVYNQCELNIKSVIAKAHLNSNTTIYDHA